jgi:hypothetical protein
MTVNQLDSQVSYLSSSSQNALANDQHQANVSMPKKPSGALQNALIFITLPKNSIKSATASPAGTIGSA